MLEKRKIAVFTGARAEYGLLYPVIQEINNHVELTCQLIVGDCAPQHFSKIEKDITADGFFIDVIIKIDEELGGLQSTARAISGIVSQMIDALILLKPDVLVIYGDRFESFAAMIAGSQMGIVCAHIEGGDLTEGGTMDDSVRHAMSKLAHLHFPTNQQAVEILAQMGEERHRIYPIGLTVNDLIKKKKFATPQEVMDKYHLDLTKPIVLFTQHSLAILHDDALKQLKPSLAALSYFSEQGMQIIITYPGCDAGGQVIIEALKAMSLNDVNTMQLHPSLGRYYYHGLLNVIATYAGGACVGNSSSGIKETPAFACPTVNIGERQKGRLVGENVLHVDYNKDAIIEAIQRCQTAAFKAQVKACVNPYDFENTSQKLVDILSTIPINKELLIKRHAFNI